MIGADALYLLFAWLASAIAASFLSNLKGYGEKPGLASGLLLFVLGPAIWLLWPSRENSRWRRIDWRRLAARVADRGARAVAVSATTAGIAGFPAAVISGSTSAYEAVMIALAIGAAASLAFPLRANARSVWLARGGLALCSFTAALDAILAFAGVTHAWLIVVAGGILAGAFLAVVGRSASR